MPRQVRLVGDADAWEVLCETPTTIVLVNPAARLRQQLAELESRLGELRAQLAHRERLIDLGGHVIDGP